MLFIDVDDEYEYKIIDCNTLARKMLVFAEFMLESLEFDVDVG